MNSSSSSPGSSGARPRTDRIPAPAAGTQDPVFMDRLITFERIPIEPPLKAIYRRLG